jgi:DNA-3-methyladenine glycosylase II
MMTLLPWHSPYDWQWMFHFLGARTVQGIETLSATAIAAASP